MEAALAHSDEVLREEFSESPLGDAKIKRVRETYRILEPASDLFATLFFHRLDEIAPEVKPFLAGDADSQKQQLLSALSLAVASLDKFEDIMPALKLLGSKYRKLGVTEFHYGAVAETLIWTLRQSLGGHWTLEAEQAWNELLTLVAETMTEQTVYLNDPVMA